MRQIWKDLICWIGWHDLWIDHQARDITCENCDYYRKLKPWE